MSFPETRPTLIARLARNANNADWQQFLKDYWGPVVRFAMRAGQMPVDQAEDLASETFLVLLRSPLFHRWEYFIVGRRLLLANCARLFAEWSEI